MKAIINTKLVMEDGIIWDGALTYEGDKIVQVGWAKDVTIPEGTEIYDAQGLYTAPGLIDIHNHGGGAALWHTPRYSVSIGPWDVINARDHLERHDLQNTGGYASWERMISRLQLYGPVCMEVPASIYQLTKGTIYVSEDMARPIEPMDLVAF